MAMYVALQGDTEEETRKQNTTTILIGTFLEYFDLLLYIHMGLIIQDYFFAADSSFQKTLSGAVLGWILSRATRPIGGILFGYFGDRYGRKNAFIISTILMGICTFFIAFLPTYKQMGDLATILFVILRIIQATSSAGEFAGAIVYLSEINYNKKNEPFIVSLVQLSIEFGGIFALTVAWFCLISEYDFAWRLPFLIGSTVAVIGSFARISLKETPEYVSEKKNYKQKKQYWKSIPENVFRLDTLPLLIICTFSGLAFFTFVLGSVKLKNFGCSGIEIIQSNLLVAIVMMITAYLSGRLTINFNPIQIVKIKSLLSLFLYPFLFYAYTTFGTESVKNFLICQCLFAIIFPWENPIFYLYSRLYKTISRCTSFSSVWLIARFCANTIFPIIHALLYSFQDYWGCFCIFFLGSFLKFVCVDSFKKYENSVLSD